MGGKEPLSSQNPTPARRLQQKVFARWVWGSATAFSHLLLIYTPEGAAPFPPSPLAILGRWHAFWSCSAVARRPSQASWGPKNPHGGMRPSGTGTSSNLAAWRMLGGSKRLALLGEAEGNNGGQNSIA